MLILNGHKAAQAVRQNQAAGGHADTDQGRGEGKLSVVSTESLQKGGKTITQCTKT